MKDYSCCLVHERARESVAASGDVSTAIRLARLVTAWRETEIRTHRARSRKPARIFHGADAHQRGESTDEPEVTKSTTIPDQPSTPEICDRPLRNARSVCFGLPATNKA